MGAGCNNRLRWSHFYREVYATMKMLSAVTRILGGLAASAIASVAVASSSNATAVPSFLSYKTNSTIVIVYFLTSTVSGPPSCATAASGNYYPLVFDSSTTEGKSILAQLIAANVAGKSLSFTGSGDCGLQSGYESLTGITSQ
jgi:hypothetical protein